MPEYDNNPNIKERQLSGETIDDGDQAQIVEIRSRLLKHVRISRGLPVDPNQLDVKAISQLPNAQVIDGDESIDQVDTHPKIIGLSTLTPTHSAVGVDIRAKRLEKLNKAA